MAQQKNKKKDGEIERIVCKDCNPDEFTLFRVDGISMPVLIKAKLMQRNVSRREAPSTHCPEEPDPDNAASS